MVSYRFVKTPEPIYVTTDEDAKYWANYFGSVGDFGYDTETTGLDPIKTRIKFASFADLDNRIALPVRLLHHFAGILEDERTLKRMSFARVDLHWSANHGIHIRGPVHDTVAADWLLDENRREHGLKATAHAHIGLRMTPFKDVFGNVGTTDAEVETLVRIHDILEAGDEDEALAMLVNLGHGDAKSGVLEGIRKLYRAKRAGYALKAYPSLVKIARECEVITKTAGKAAYVRDFLAILHGDDLELTPTEREELQSALTDHSLLVDAYDVLLARLREKVALEDRPLELLTLLVADYASLDAWASNALFKLHYYDEMAEESLSDEDDGEGTMLDLFVDQISPFTRVLWNMERRGVSIDLEAAAALEKPMRHEMGKISRKIVEIAGFDLNPDSAVQLRGILFEQDRNGDWVDMNGDPPFRMTKGGASGIKLPAVDKDTLQIYADRGDALCEKVLEYRALAKLHGTYINNMPEWVDHRGRVHTTLLQTGTVTGRLSSKDPNLQNIPARSELGKRIRFLFVPGKYGDVSPEVCLDEVKHVAPPNLPKDFPMTLIVADYEQVEMRVMAHFSEDEEMIYAIKSDKDLHCWTGHLAAQYIKQMGLVADLFDYDDLLAAKKAAKNGSTDPKVLQLVRVRDSMKAVGFGLLYGIGAVKLGRQLGLPVTESFSRKTGRTYQKCPLAEDLIAAYFEAFPKVRAFIENTKAAVHEDLFVRTYLGRKRRLPDIKSSQKVFAAMAERQSVNSRIQGTAADITNTAMLRCELDPELRALGVRMLLQVHDELMFEVPDRQDIKEKAADRIRANMENPLPMRVPIAISLGEAKSWGDAK
jgi:DNA polymerase I-like protein with 3'-5' exonuclease and polymerase domains